jgi:hypothetical protein
MTERKATGAERRWRRLAEEARGQAARMTDAEACRTMSEIAEAYERLAERAKVRGDDIR